VANKRELKLKAEKWAIWLALVGVIFLLRHLFPVIFLTFVLSYIANTIVRALTRRWQRRRLNVVIVYTGLLLLLTGVGLLVVPRLFAEAKQLAVSYMSQETGERDARRYVDSALLRVFGAETFRDFADSDAYAALIVRAEESVRHYVPRVIGAVREFANASLALLFQFLMSIILSFLIVWDLPSLQRGVQGLATGKTAEVYEEIAPGMSAFGVMLGRAFEAQTGIAVVNALLTSIGFWILGIPSIALLATIVFFCSYIPVVGVMLSTVPAALFAFKTGGVPMVLWLVVMVLVVHAVEAYLLNPIIYGRHMKMHPVAILVILLIGEHVFGVWGLVLGVPIAAFVWNYVIRSVAQRTTAA
jgi:predicted PurR-regulated permease PerM